VTSTPSSRPTSTVTVLDDYQQVALGYTDWTPVTDRFTVDVVTEHIADTDDLVARLAGSEVVVAMRERTPFPASTLERLPALKLLITTGMHNASIDVAAANRLGIVVSGTGGAGNAMPELTIGMILAITRHLAEEDAAVRRGEWQHTVGTGLAGRTLGVVGLGRIGIPVAKLAQAFGMRIIAWSPNLTAERAAEHGVTAVSRHELFAAADVVTIHMPLSDRSRGLIGTDDLAEMKPTAYLVNNSRGPIVDEAALVAALRTRRIAGAALDVYDVEPLPVDHILRTLPNTLLLPHIGYVTTDAYEVFYTDAVADIVAYLVGDPVRVLAPVAR
jgi:phosphoglycerate dehydrogenase-like enzyme